MSADAEAPGWRNRIIGEGMVDPAELAANPLNFRTHGLDQQQALTGALERIGWVQRVVVNKRTMTIVDGHLRAKLGDRVLDPCAGSGSTLIACEQMGMIAHLVELDPRYADAIITRWQEFTGGTAYRMTDNAAFASLSPREIPA